MKNKTTLILILIIVSILALSMVNAQACNPGTTNSACGQPITTTGQGATQLCNNCYPCGIADGVCPTLYSTGQITNDKYVYIKSGIADRPTAHANYTTSFDTGNLACQSIGATFDMMQTRTSRTQLWTNVTTISGIENVSTNTEYYRAICTNVPSTPNCEACPDPDCTTEIKGIAYNKNTNSLIDNVLITILTENTNHPQRTTTMLRQATSNEQGQIELQGYTGNVTVICSADYYEPNTKQITLQPGKNIIDCEMTSAVCAADCTLPGARGTRICSTQCIGENGCLSSQLHTLGTDMINTLDVCNYLNKNTFFVLEREIIGNQLNLTGVRCCSQIATTPITSELVPIFNPQGPNIRNLITRTFNKELDGEPVEIKIVVYNKR